MKDHGGAIINISATIYYTGTPLQAHAGSAKAAIGSAIWYILFDVHYKVLLCLHRCLNKTSCCRMGFTEHKSQ